MHPFRLLTATLAGFLLLSAARPALAAPHAQELPPDPETLANLTYPAEGSEQGYVTLTDGEYMHAGEDYRLSLTLRPEYTIWGDLDGDDDSDAVVVTVLSGGGSGKFYELHAVLDDDGAATVVGTALLGDRVGILNMGIDGAGGIVTEIVTHGPADPLCCPTQDVVRTYRLDAGELVLEEEIPVETEPDTAVDPRVIELGMALTCPLAATLAVVPARAPSSTAGRASTPRAAIARPSTTWRGATR